MTCLYVKGQTLHYVITSAEKMLSRVCLIVQHYLIPYTRLCSMYWLKVRFCRIAIGFSRVAQASVFLARLSAKLLMWKWFSILIQIKLIFTRKVLHLVSLNFESGSFCNSEMACQADLSQFCRLSREFVTHRSQLGGKVYMSSLAFLARSEKTRFFCQTS